MIDYSQIIARVHETIVQLERNSSFPGTELENSTLHHLNDYKCLLGLVDSNHRKILKSEDDFYTQIRLK